MVERGGRAAAQGWAFERFVRDILAGQPDVTGVEGEVGAAGDLGIDIAGRQGGRPVLVEAKAQTPQTSARLQDVIARLQEASAYYSRAHPESPRPRLVVAFPGILSPRKETPVAAAQVEIWDGPFLQREARRLAIRAPSYLAAAEGEESPEEREPTDDLLRRLGRVPPGVSNSVRFEKFCEDMLNFLFCPPLNQVIPQSSTESRVNRRDFIMPNYVQDGFWHFMRVHYHADFVVADAKNFTGGIPKDEVLKIANYLTRHGTGLVGLLLTRRGLRRSAKWTCREQWLLHDKLIVGFDDEDYRQMLLSKRAGVDPSDLVRQRIEDFRLQI
jgi:hypothetical protein